MTYMTNNAPALHHHDDLPGVELTNCTHKGCHAEFCWVPSRQFPTLCIEHAADADRDANSWNPFNSTN